VTAVYCTDTVVVTTASTAVMLGQAPKRENNKPFEREPMEVYSSDGH